MFFWYPFLVSCWGVHDKTHRYMFQTIVFGIYFQYPANVIAGFSKSHPPGNFCPYPTQTGNGKGTIIDSNKHPWGVQGYVKIEMKVNLLGDLWMFSCIVSLRLWILLKYIYILPMDPRIRCSECI